MHTTKYLGIYMDHASAHLMDFTPEKIGSDTILSNFTAIEKKETLQKGENAMHHKEQHEQLAYYKSIGAVIMGYNEVLLFGPTEAKNELVNLLKADHHFDKINIEIKQASKMTQPQEHAFIKDYFLNK